MNIGSQGASNDAQSSCAVAVRCHAMRPFTRTIATAALTPLEVLVGRGGDAFDLTAPRNPVMRNGLVGCLGHGLAVSAAVMGTGLCVGMHVLTHPLSFTRRSVIRAGEMGAMTVGGIGYTGISAAFGALLGVARMPVARLRDAVECANNMMPIC